MEKDRLIRKTSSGIIMAQHDVDGTGLLDDPAHPLLLTETTSELVRFDAVIRSL